MVTRLTYFSRSSTSIFYRPQRSCEGYVFTPVLSVILFTGGGLSSVHAGIPSQEQTLPQADPPKQTPPRSRHPPGADTPRWEQKPPPQEQTPVEQTPPGADTPPGKGYCCVRYASYWNAFLVPTLLCKC